VTIVLASTGKVLPVGAPSTDTRTEVESGTSTTGTDIGTVLVLVHIVRYSSTRTDSACTRRNLYYY
jgi:hypothetical protein